MKKWINIYNAIMGALVIVFVNFITPVCTGKVTLKNGMQAPMKCHYTAVAATMIGVIALVMALELYRKKQCLPITFILIGAILIALPLRTPLSIGVCMKAMACHKTALVLKVLGGILILTNMATYFSKKDNQKLV